MEARRILDEELYGMESVKQRIIETIIQINRTHTLPAYGLLLVRTGRNRKVTDCICCCTYSQASMDHTRYELHK